VPREWLGLDRAIFYDESRIAIMPIGLCYPGRDTRGGDLPPRRECAPRWHMPLRAVLPAIELTLLVGSILASIPRRGMFPLLSLRQRFREQGVDGALNETGWGLAFDLGAVALGAGVPVLYHV
jgi:uracil-DNA glycosylase